METKEIMDYEKKYNEALKWMRELYPGLHGATKEDAEHYFPELAESEDERIWQWLYDIVDTGSFLIEKPCETEKILAWLEKQKEPENASASTIIPSCWAEEPSMQKEQKPAWSEEDEDIRQSIIKDIKWERDNTPVTVDKDIRKYDKQINWLKSLRPSWKPSDQDELMKLKYAGTSTKLD